MMVITTLKVNVIDINVENKWCNEWKECSVQTLKDQEKNLLKDLLNSKPWEEKGDKLNNTELWYLFHRMTLEYPEIAT